MKKSTLLHKLNRPIITLLLLLLAGGAFADPHFFDGKKIRQIETLPKTQDQAGFQFFYNTLYYNLFFSKHTVAMLKSACNSYISDFEKTKISRKDKKSLVKYGQYSARLEWGTSRKNTAQFSDNASISFGYAFIKKSPYFVIIIQDSQSQISADADSELKASPALSSSGDIALFFTKAQIAELVAALE